MGACFSDEYMALVLALHSEQISLCLLVSHFIISSKWLLNHECS